MKKHNIILLILFVYFSGSFFSHLSANTHDVFVQCEVSGSTTLYDLRKDKWIKTDADDAQVRTLPASTFKIFNSLIALDMGVTDANEVFKWDGQKRSIEVWNRDMVLHDAFKYSAIWVYEELARRIGPEVYSSYFKRTNYSNGKITHGRDGNFWVYGDFGVSPVEQIEMLVKLYNRELPFSLQTTNMVKSMMRVEDAEGREVFGKTGWAVSGKSNIGWWIGYYDFEEGPLFFATRIVKESEKPLRDFLECRKRINDSVIKEIGGYAKH